MKVDLVSENGESISKEVLFSILGFVPTFSADLAPIHSNSCVPCHDPGGTARPLSTVEDWRNNIDAIITSVTEGSMPLGAAPEELLTPDQIGLIEAWKASGMQQ